MSQEQDALQALRNAWNGVLSSVERLREAGPEILELPPTASIQDVNLDRMSTLALAQANAAQALRGLVEQLRRKSGAGDATPVVTDGPES